MANNEANVYYQLPIVRVTKLSRCGTPQLTCSSLTDECVVSIEETGEYRERQEFFPENGAGRFCMERTNPPRRKWINLVITFNDTNPKMIGMVTGDTVLFNDKDVTPEAIGFSVTQDAVDDSHFALEGWLNVGSRCGDEDTCSEAGSETYGYVVYPHVKEATIGDRTYGNDTVTFTVNAIATRQNNWGVGPYNVVKSAAAATLGDPLPLFDPITGEYYDFLFTEMAPPTAQCDCIDLVPVLAFADTGVLTGTVTIPTLAGTLPADIDWDDGTPVQTVTAGTTVQHVYAAPGNYAPTLTPRNTSSATYVAASTPIA